MTPHGFGPVGLADDPDFERLAGSQGPASLPVAELWIVPADVDDYDETTLLFDDGLRAGLPAGPFQVWTRTVEYPDSTATDVLLLGAGETRDPDAAAAGLLAGEPRTFDVDHWFSGVYVGAPRDTGLEGWQPSTYRWSSLSPYGADGILFGDPDNIEGLRVWADDRSVLVGEHGSGTEVADELGYEPTTWRRGQGFPD